MNWKKYGRKWLWWRRKSQEISLRAVIWTCKAEMLTAFSFIFSLPFSCGWATWRNMCSPNCIIFFYSFNKARRNVTTYKHWNSLQALNSSEYMCFALDMGVMCKTCTYPMSVKGRESFLYCPTFEWPPHLFSFTGN